LYNRDRVIYTDNDKLYIRYKNEYLLLKKIKGGGEGKVLGIISNFFNIKKDSLDSDEKQKNEDEKQKNEDEKQKNEDEKLIKLENEEAKREEFINILKHMLNGIVDKTNNYSSYIINLEFKLKSVLAEDKGDTSARFKDILFDKFFMTYILEIIGYEDYSEYIFYLNQIQENNTDIVDTITSIIEEHKNIYTNNFTNFKIYWDKQKGEMGKNNEIKEMIKKNIDVINYDNNDLYNNIKYTHNIKGEKDIKDKFNTIKKYYNFNTYIDFIIYFFNYIVYTSFKKEFDKIKEYTKKY